MRSSHKHALGRSLDGAYGFSLMPRAKRDALCAGTTAGFFWKHENTPIAARRGSVCKYSCRKYSGGGKVRGAAVASAARVTRAGAKLLEPIFQRKRLLRLRLGIPADRMLLASRLGGRSAVPWQGFGIGWALMCGRCGRRWAFGGWPIDRGHLSGQRLQGRSLRGWCFWERYPKRWYLDQRYLDERSRDAWQKGRRHFRGRGWPWCRADRTRYCAVYIRR
jgi:hypothetical protein